MQPKTAKSLPITAAVSAADVAAYLEKNGVKVLNISEPDETVDGEIGLENNFSVQVGQGYAILTKYSGEGKDFTVSYFQTRYDALHILQDIKEKLG